MQAVLGKLAWRRNRDLDFKVVIMDEAHFIKNKGGASPPQGLLTFTMQLAPQLPWLDAASKALAVAEAVMQGCPAAMVPA